MDYDAITDEVLDFPLGQARVCFSININDDDTCETEIVQSFFSNLILGSGVQPIDIDPSQAQVIIHDDDQPECGKFTKNLGIPFYLVASILPAPIDVGYEFTIYHTSETLGEVQLCARVYIPTVGGALRPFTISSTTRNGSASKSNACMFLNEPFDNVLCQLISCRGRL